MSGRPRDHDLYYFRSILKQLRDVRDCIHRGDDTLAISSVVLCDNIDWLDAYIQMHEHDRTFEQEVAARRVL